MRVLVYGGRTFRDAGLLWRRLDILLSEALQFNDPLTIIQGESGTYVNGRAFLGADLLGKQWAIDNEVPHLDFPAAWKDFEAKPCIIVHGQYGPYNRLAGHNRNRRMLVEGQPDLAIECKGKSGTLDMRTRLLKAKVPIIYLH